MRVGGFVRVKPKRMWEYEIAIFSIHMHEHVVDKDFVHNIFVELMNKFTGKDVVNFRNVHHWQIAYKTKTFPN